MGDSWLVSPFPAKLKRASRCTPMPSLPEYIYPEIWWKMVASGERKQPATSNLPRKHFSSRSTFGANLVILAITLLRKYGTVDENIQMITEEYIRIFEYADSHILLTSSYVARNTFKIHNALDVSNSWQATSNNRFHVEMSSQFILHSTISNAYKYSFILIPMYVLLVFVLFIRFYIRVKFSHNQEKR